MSLFITSLNSGSNGNCYYIANEREAILVDAGISCREIEKRMNRLGLSMQKIKAIFISHEHTDHIKGLCTLLKKYKITLYITASTLLACGFSPEENLVKFIQPNEPVVIGDLSVTGFQKMHDACDPYSFIVCNNNIKVGVFTDIGTVCCGLIKYFKQCNAAFLEANFDEEMLDKGTYPYFLKKRIRDGKGHLSNKQAIDLFTAHKPTFMTHLILSHLSQNNNCALLVEKLFTEVGGGVKMVIASRFHETPIYKIGSNSNKIITTRSPFSPQLTFSFA